MLVNKNSSNEQLIMDPKVREALEKGECILIDKQVTSNPDYTTLFIVGYVENAGTSSANAAQAALLGWDQPSFFVARCVQNAKTSVAEKFEVGHVFDDFALQIVDKTAPQYPNHEPRRSKKDEIYMSEDGKMIYRSFILTTKAELEAQGHQVIKRQPVAQTASATIGAMLNP